MFRTICSTLVVALVALCVASTVALAAETTVSGTVQSVDARKGHITLRSEEGKTVELQAPAELLAGLQTGDAVEVKVSGQKATLIHKQQGALRPEMDGVLPRQQPGELRPSQ